MHRCVIYGINTHIETLCIDVSWYWPISIADGHFGIVSVNFFLCQHLSKHFCPSRLIYRSVVTVGV